jgi:hypothetical protein
MHRRLDAGRRPRALLHSPIVTISRANGGAKGRKQSTLLLLIADTENGFNDRRQEPGTSMRLNLTRITFLHRGNNA